MGAANAHRGWLVAVSIAVGVCAAGLGSVRLGAQANVQGQWQTLSYLMPINPVHITLLNNGRVLVVAGSGNVAAETHFQAAVWDPQANTIDTQPLSWDMFCNGAVVLPDGRVFVNGGNLQYDPFRGEPRNAVYDPATNLFTNVQNMAHGRWYPTVTVLGNGSVMTFSGLNETTGATNTAVEIYTAGSGWSQEYAAGWTPPLYPRMHLISDGRVFYSGSGRGSRFFNPTTKAWSAVVATMNYSNSRTYGTSVLLPLLPADGYKSRVMIFGGGNPATNTTEIIDLSAGSPQWQFGPPMSQPRIEMNATILPNGKVLAMGGSTNDEDASTASLKADLYDPQTNTFSPAGSNVYPRLYHSGSLLLPDATVMLVGGNPVRGSYEQHIEIYSPAYLFTGTQRPTITAVTPGTIGYGGTFQVQTPDAASITSVVLVRPGSQTHAFDMDQRLIGLTYTTGNGVLSVTAPPNGNVAPPGYYMLFILNSAGVPSVATFVQLSTTAPANQAPTATITSPTSNVTINPGDAVIFSGTGSDPDGSISAYAWTFPGGNPSSSNSANAGQVFYSTPGSYVASLTVTDNQGLASAAATRTVTVADFSLAATPASQSVSAGGSTSYTATVAPLNGFTGTVTFDVSGLPSGATASFNPSAVSTSGSTTLSVSTSSSTPAGSYPLTITGTSGPRTRSANVTLVVTAPANTAPTISALTPQTILEDSSTGALGVTLGDAETAAGSLTLTGSSSNATLVPVGNILFGGAGANRTVAVTPGANQSGTATITVTVSDGQATASTSFLLTVTPVNDGPTISSVPNQTTTSGVAVGPLAVTVGDVETAAGSLTLSGSTSNPTLVPVGNIVFGGTGTARTVTVTPAAGQTGTATLTLTVSDGLATTSTSFLLTVTATPVGLIGAWGMNEGAGTTLGDSSGNGRTGTITGATWTAGKYGQALNFDGNDWVSLGDLDLAQSFTVMGWLQTRSLYPGTCGSFVMKAHDYGLEVCGGALYASVGDGTRWTATVTHTLTTADLGVWTHLALSYDGTSVRLYVNGTLINTASGGHGANDDPLLFGRWTPASEYWNGLIDEVQIYSRALNQAEIQTVMNTPVGGTAPENQAPTATITSPATNVTINPGQAVAFSGTGSDPDGSISAYAWTFPGGSPSSSTSANAGNVTYATPGSYVASLTVTDNQGLASAAATRTVTVSDFSLSAAPSSQSVTAGAGTSFSATVTPLNGFTGTVTFGVGGLPSGATASFNPSAVSTSGSTTMSVSTSSSTTAGSYPLTITGSSGPRTRSGNVTLVVTAPNQAPTATITSPTTNVTINPGDAVIFSGTGSDPDGSITAYAWAFPGGTPSSSTSANAGNVTYLTPGSYVASLTVTDNQGLVSLAVTRTITVSDLSDFSLSTSPSIATIPKAGSTSYTVTLTPLNGFTGTVTFAVNGLPKFASARFNPQSVVAAGNTQLAVSTNKNVAAGTYTLVVTGTSGSRVRSTSVSLIVQ